MPAKKAARPKTKTADDARKFAVAAARLALHDNCEDIVVLDLRKISPITDYFVIATGTSDRQMRSVADDIAAAGKKAAHKPYKIAGEDSAEWIVMDFFDVVVHLFDAEHRGFYDLELIWGEAPKVRWQTAAKKKAAD